jgi:hypothetical protein
MQFKIISGTTIHEYAEECATAPTRSTAYGP